MRVDIYRRPEAHKKFSYLAVPEGRTIPEEATNVDWDTELRGIDLDGDASEWGAFGIHQAEAQIAEKGYAITSVKDLEDAR